MLFAHSASLPVAGFKGPTTRLCHLGWEVDTLSLSLSTAPERREFMLRELRVWGNRRSATSHELLSLAGQLQHIAQAFSWAKPFLSGVSGLAHVPCGHRCKLDCILRRCWARPFTANQEAFCFYCAWCFSTGRKQRPLVYKSFKSYSNGIRQCLNLLGVNFEAYSQMPLLERASCGYMKASTTPGQKMRLPITTSILRSQELRRSSVLGHGHDRRSGSLPNGRTDPNGL